MLLRDITERLKTLTDQNGAPFITEVLTAVDRESVLDTGIVRRDAAFVVPIGEYGNGEFLYTGLDDQKIEVRFGVILAVRAVNDRLGQNVNERLEAMYRAVRRHLIGWTPTANDADPIAFVDGEIIFFGQGGAFWFETYTTSYTETPTE
ncbi:hypothetical protein JYB87_11840 [Shewanella avicenniae]|uniref:Gp37 protein n=1 Tax=Shewanella avicenniae TaxID=2814294 RepID=A0ABX7QNJ9_9GAMM|nr:hypothetical protein [Shewanella avicenniae]QSX32458.1 hypothetical protein JYB87_11840 [Shewanella avicenniae]